MLVHFGELLLFIFVAFKAYQGQRIVAAVNWTLRREAGLAAHQANAPGWSQPRNGAAR